MLNGLTKLRLERGDILVVKHPDTLKALEGLGKVVDFTVPVVYCPFGIKTLKREDLLNLLEQLEQQDSPTLPTPDHVPA